MYAFGGKSIGSRAQICQRPCPFGQIYATLSVTDNAAGSPQSFGLTGNVIGQGLVFTVPALRFGQQAVATKSAPQKVSLINGTGAALTISSIKASADFAQGNTCGTSLGAGAYCYITVSFKPASIGIKQGSITVVDSASGSPQVLPSSEQATDPSFDSKCRREARCG